jgi:DNA-directed RNA polymerase beta' subunit
MLAQPPGGRLPRAQAIGRVQFTLLSSDEQKKHAALTLETSEPLEHGSARVHPLGPLSKALGAIERGDICSSCKGGAGECRSHAGTLSLHGTLLIEPKTIPLLVQLLTCVCFGCRELLLTGTRHDDLKMATAMRAAVHLECRQFTTLLESVHDTGRVRFQKLFDLARIRRTCFHCLRLQPDFRETPRGIEFIVRSRGGGSKNKKKGLASSTTSTSWTWLQPKALLALLKGISNETYARLGLAPRVSHPSWTVHDHLPFPPLALCPPRRQDLADRVLDHIATRAVRISDEARKLSLRTGLRESERERRARDLQLAYRGMLLSAPAENARTKAPSHGAQRERVEEWTLPVDLPLQSRLEGKEGDIRLRLLGHRVEQTARGVIVESPEIPPGWVGVPADVARKLCVHVTVPVQEEARRALQRNVVDRGMYDPAGVHAHPPTLSHTPCVLLLQGQERCSRLWMGVGLCCAWTAVRSRQPYCCLDAARRSRATPVPIFTRDGCIPWPNDGGSVPRQRT